MSQPRCHLTAALPALLAQAKGLLVTTAVHLHWELAPTKSTEIQEQRSTEIIQVQMLETVQILSHRQHHINIRTKVLKHRNNFP